MGVACFFSPNLCWTCRFLLDSTLRPAAGMKTQLLAPNQPHTFHQTQPGLGPIHVRLWRARLPRKFSRIVLMQQGAPQYLSCAHAPQPAVRMLRIFSPHLLDTCMNEEIDK